MQCQRAKIRNGKAIAAHIGDYRDYAEIGQLQKIAGLVGRSGKWIHRMVSHDGVGAFCNCIRCERLGVGQRTSHGSADQRLSPSRLDRRRMHQADFIQRQRKELAGVACSHQIMDASISKPLDQRLELFNIHGTIGAIWGDRHAGDSAKRLSDDLEFFAHLFALFVSEYN
ncbi:hypothetical protein D9M70_548380 [compost metagenome]